MKDVKEQKSNNFRKSYDYENKFGLGSYSSKGKNSSSGGNGGNNGGGGGGGSCCCCCCCCCGGSAKIEK